MVKERQNLSVLHKKNSQEDTSEPQAARPGPSGFLLVLLGIPEHPPPSQMFLQSFVPETKSLPGLHHLTSQQKNSSGGNLRAPIPQLRKDQLPWMRPPVYNHCTFLPASRQRDTHFSSLLPNKNSSELSPLAQHNTYPPSLAPSRDKSSSLS